MGNQVSKNQFMETQSVLRRKKGEIANQKETMELLLNGGNKISSSALKGDHYYDDHTEYFGNLPNRNASYHLGGLFQGHSGQA